MFSICFSTSPEGICAQIKNNKRNFGTLAGVNISGAELNGNNPNGRLFFDYIYPTHAEIDYYVLKGFKVIRLPFSGARLQPFNQRPLAAGEIRVLRESVSYAISKGIKVILDPHDYGMKYDSTTKTMLAIGQPGGMDTSNFIDFWRRIAIEFRAEPNVLFGLMNEPNKQTAAQWRIIAQKVVKEIRATGANQTILIPGTAWSGAHSWVVSGNAAAWAGFADPEHNFAFEVHQYMDKDRSGTTDSCERGIGKNSLKDVTRWARKNGYTLFLGEFGWAENAACMEEGTDLLDYIGANKDIWIGWTYWTGGAWYPKTYMFLIRPDDLEKPIDKQQMQTLIEHL